MEPRIKRAMDEYPVGSSCSTSRKPNCNAGERPYPVHHHAVKTACVFMEPAPKARRESISAQKRPPQSMHGTLKVRQKWLTGIVHANHLHFRAYFAICLCKLAHRLWRSSGRWGKAVD